MTVSRNAALPLYHQLKAFVTERIESGEWSADNRRVYLHSDITCGAGVKRTGSGIVAISPIGEWIDVQSVSAAGNTSVRAVHYRSLGADAIAAVDVKRLRFRRNTDYIHRVAGAGPTGSPGPNVAPTGAGFESPGR